jgi:hypothetical protein
MANVKISALSATGAIVPGTDVLPLVNGGATTKATPNAVVQAVLPAPGAIGGTTPAAGAFTTLTATTSIGYPTGSGGTITQTTNRSTGVTLDKICGYIQTDTTSLAAEASAVFTVTNATVAIGDVVVVSIRSGSNGGNTAVNVTTVANGSFAIRVSNNNAAAGTAETGAILINFAVIKAVSA